MSRRSWPWILLVVVTAALSLRALDKRHGSLYRNRLFAAGLLEGQDPYAPWHADGRPLHAPYPPSYGMVMAPLLLVPLPMARVLWVLLQILVLTLVLRRLQAWWCHLPATRGPPPLWVFGFSLLLISRYLLRDTAGGGNNLVFGGLALLACCRPDEAPG